MAERPKINPGKKEVPTRVSPTTPPSTPPAPKKTIAVTPVSAVPVMSSSPAQPQPVAPPPVVGSSNTPLIIAGVVVVSVLGIIAAGTLLYVTEIKPARDFKPRTEIVTFERSALEDTVPEVRYDKYLDRASLGRYYEGDGLELRFVTHFDPRKGYADTEVKCGIPQAEDINFTKKPREAASNALPATVKQCVDAFLAPIPRTVPVNVLVDVTEGSKPIESTVRKLIGDLERRLASPYHTFDLQVSLIFDGPYTVYKEWEVLPGSTSTQVEAVLKQATDWALAPKGVTLQSSISFGLLNGLRLRREKDLRGGMVFVASDGFEYALGSKRDPELIDFYRARTDPSYLAPGNWAKYDSKILVDNGGTCNPLFGARVDWYPPPSMDLTVRVTAKYWEHFLGEKCGAGSFEFHP